MRQEANLRWVAWEVTRRCNLSCIHCRAGAEDRFYPDELTTEEGFRLLDEIVAVGQPTIILTGGEPLLRKDIFELAAYGAEKGLRMVMAPNGTLVTPQVACRMLEVGIKRISISLDGATPESHDGFRQMPGAFRGALAGIQAAKEMGLGFQINTTVTRDNHHELEEILKLAVDLGAVAHHIFFLVPTGRANLMEGQEVSPEEYEKTLNWLYDQRTKVPLQLRPICAPHYFRVLRQRAKEEGTNIPIRPHGLNALTRGCLAGSAFCFVSHVGDVFPCGYLGVNCGNTKEQNFKDVWEKSMVFDRLRNLNGYGGKCGYCEYRKVCGGCRARAYAKTGNYLDEEPNCIYEPKT